MTAFRTLDQVEVSGRRVLVRLDLNVPMQGGRVTDATRIDRAAPTVRELADKGARVVVVSHYGRPKGKPDPALSLAPLVEPLAAAVQRPVAFAADCVGPTAAAVVDRLADGQVALLENLRFHAGEEANDPSFADALAELCDLYVDDAFSAAHRAHASIDGVARRRPPLALQRPLNHLRPRPAAPLPPPPPPPPPRAAAAAAAATSSSAIGWHPRRHAVDSSPQVSAARHRPPAAGVLIRLIKSYF